MDTVDFIKMDTDLRFDGTSTRMLSGKHMNYLSPKSTSVDFSDIAHGLANIRRFCGQLPRNVDYTVLDHSIGVAKVVKILGGSRTARAYALLHDAPEAYTNDIPQPLKQAFRLHQSRILDSIENDLMEVIWAAAGFVEWPSRDELDLVKSVDQAMAREEHLRFRVARTGVRTKRKVHRWWGQLRSLGVDLPEAPTFYDTMV